MTETKTIPQTNVWQRILKVFYFIYFVIIFIFGIAVFFNFAPEEIVDEIIIRCNNGKTYKASENDIDFGRYNISSSETSIRNLCKSN